MNKAWTIDYLFCFIYRNDNIYSDTRPISTQKSLNTADIVRFNNNGR